MRIDKKKAAVAIVWVIALCMMAALILHNNPLEDATTARLKKLSGLALLLLFLSVLTVFYDKLFTLPVELWQNRRLIWRLARNDFKKRYAGSYLGVIWALVPPIITVGSRSAAMRMWVHMEVVVVFPWVPEMQRALR